MFFPIYIILFSIIPFFFKDLSIDEKKVHFYLLIFLISFLSVISLNGPDISTYRKNYYSFGENLSSTKYLEYFFSSLIVFFRNFDLNFIVYQAVVKIIFLSGFYIFIKKMFDEKFDYLFVIIFASIYFIPVASITNLYQMAAIGLFFILISFKEFKLIRDIPIILLSLTMHKSAMGIVILYSINFFLQYRRISYFKKIFNLILFSLVPFTIFSIFNVELLKNFLSNYINTADLQISYFSLIWFVLYIILVINFIASRQAYKKFLSRKDYNYLISTSIFFIFIFNIYFISEVFALRFLYYAFPFFLFCFGLISKTTWIHFSKFRNYYIKIYVCGAFLFIGFWYGIANHKLSFENYKFIGGLEIFCPDLNTCSKIYNSDQNIYRIISQHLKLEEHDENEILDLIDKNLGVDEKFKKDPLLNK